MRWKRLILIATCLVALSGVFTWLAEAAWGRVGGGQTYRGRSYSSSRSSSYGGSWGRRRSNDFYFFYLLIQYPWLIIPVFGLIFLYSWAKSQSQEQEQLSFLREGDRYQRYSSSRTKIATSLSPSSSILSAASTCASKRGASAVSPELATT